MFHIDPVLHKERNCMVVSRAATGIYLVLSRHCKVGDRVAVPANLCYAGILPAQYAGLKLCFFDVDARSGNATMDSFSVVADLGVKAAIIPHMYGQPVMDMPMIAEMCKKRGILLIEDCASAMGAEADYPIGRMGDYTVYSTGYSKTMDLGCGGLLCSDLPMSGLEDKEKELPEMSNDAGKNMALFSKIYRLLRNCGEGTALERSIYRGIPEPLKSGLICSLPEGEKQRIWARLKDLPDIVDRRRKMLKEYKWCLRGHEEVFYPFSEGAVPWRFSLLVSCEKRKRIIDAMLNQDLPVSDWYPRVTPIFLDDGEYPGAEWHEKHVLNFPLLLEQEKVEEICEVLRALL